MIINLTSSTLFSLALSLLLPVFMYAIVLEKEEKLIEMMKMNGCSISLYWLTVFIFNLLIEFVTFAVFLIVGTLLIDNDFFTKTGADIFAVVFLGWSVGQIGVAVFFQTFIETARSANIVGYLLSIWTSIIVTTLNIGIFSYPQAMNSALLSYPPFAFGRIIYVLLSHCSNDACLRHISEFDSELVYAVCAMYVGGFILLFLGMYFYEIVPKSIGVSRKWYFPI